MVFYDRFSSTGTDIDIAGKFVMESRMDTLVSATPERPGGNNDIKSQMFAILVKGIMTCILSIVTAFMLLMSAGFFIVRTVSFIILILISPLAFVGYAIPYLKDRVYEPWKKELIGQATFAPVFMGLFYFTVKLTEGVNNLSINSLDSVTGAAIIYGILMMMMFNCLLIARKSASGMASSTLKGLGLTGLNAMGASLGFAGSALGGRYGQWQLNAGRGIFGSNSRLDKWAAKQMTTRTWNPMNAVKAADKKIDEIKGGKGPGFNNRSLVQRQKDDKEKAKNQAEDHKKQIKAIEKDGGATAAAEYINKLSENQRSAFYESLTISERGKYEAAAAEGGTKDVWKKLRTDLKDEEAKKQSTQAVRKASRNIGIKDAKNDLLIKLTKAIDPSKDFEDKDGNVIVDKLGKSTPELIKMIGSGGLTDIADTYEKEFDKIISDQQFYKHFNGEQMQALYDLKKDGALDDTQWDTILTDMRANGTEDARKWIAKKDGIPWNQVEENANPSRTPTANIEDLLSSTSGPVGSRALTRYLQSKGFRPNDNVTITKKDGSILSAITYKGVKQNGMIEIIRQSSGMTEEIDPTQIKTMTK